jgi:hypothetical protein
LLAVLTIGNLRERNHVGDPGLDGSIKLRWIFRKLEVVVWTGSSWLRIGTCSGTCGKLVSFSRRTLVHGGNK